MNNTAFIFPAFISDFTQKELDFLERNQVDFKYYIKMASEAIGIEIPPFSYDAEIYKTDELLSQIIAYLFSCAFFDTLTKKGIKTNYAAGYSMGIYATLYAAGVIGLKDGIKIIYKAYTLVSNLSCTGSYGMGAIIGLNKADIEKLITENSLDAEIINVNNEHSMVAAGIKQDIMQLLELARHEGAISASELTVNTPYHSKFLKQFSESFLLFLNTLEFKAPDSPILSTYNQRVITEVNDVKLELVYNLTEKINWYDTVQSLLKLGVNTFYECGAGKDLSKISRFIEGDYHLKSVYKI